MFSKSRTEFYRRTDVKMTLWYIFTFFVSAILIFGFLYVRLRHQLIKEVDRFIMDETKELTEIVIQNPSDKEVLRKFESHIESRSLYPLYFQILSENGRAFYASESFRKIGYEVKERVLANAKVGKETREIIPSSGRGRSFRFISIPVLLNGKHLMIIQIGTHLKFVEKDLSNFRSNLFAVLPVVLILGSIGGWILARKSLSPIGYIVSKTRSITSKNLDERLISRGTKDEMDDLIRTINEMIGRLEESFKRMAEFTADASHELKTPICAMRGEAEVLLSRSRATQEYQEGLVHFIEQFDRMNRVINDLILLSKSDTSQIELKRVPVRLDLLLRNISDLFQVLAREKGLNLVIDSVQETVVMGDELLLQQLFTNLIDNAIKYTLKGSIQITIEKVNKMAIVKIKDTGIGIPMEEQANIFKRFYRVDKSRSKETSGVGLGLSIVEWIVYAHKGKIEVESEINKGSTFTVRLPLQMD